MKCKYAMLLCYLVFQVYAFLMFSGILFGISPYLAIGGAVVTFPFVVACCFFSFRVVFRGPEDECHPIVWWRNRRKKRSDN